MNTKYIPYLAILAAMLIWSFSFIWSKLAFETYQPFTILFFRLSIASASLAILAHLMRKLQKVHLKDFKFFVALTLFEPFFYFLGENFGLQRVSPGIASVIIATIPLFMPFVGLFFLKETLNRYNILGLLISMSGVLLVIIKPDLSFSADITGILLLFVAVASALGYSLILKKLTRKYNGYTIVVWQNLLGALFFLPFFLFYDFKAFVEIDVWNVNTLYVVALALFASNLAFLFYTRAMTSFDLKQISLFTNLIPVFTLIISFFVFGETLKWYSYAGIALVLGGLYIAERQNRKSQADANLTIS